MKVAVYKGPKKVEEVENFRISKPTNDIIRITCSAICGSDLHMYDGETTRNLEEYLGIANGSN
jgi:glutathione-independent formaldehyde dehydrogenase